MVTTQTKRKTLVGVVVAAKNPKTVAVNVESYRKHRLYGKRFRRDKKYQVHDPHSKAKLGDKVLIQETRPRSATKRFLLLKVLSSYQGVK